MTLVVGTIQNLFSGVSQQPDSLRRETQAEEQINGYSTVVDGVVKRPPTKHLAKISSTAFGNSFIHTYKRDETEQYSVVMTNGDLKVFDVTDGSEKTVTFPDGKGYLTATDPRIHFVAVTVADFTFIVNKSVTVLMDTPIGAGGLTGVVQNFSKLPGAPGAGQIYKIEGDPNNDFDTYYVRFNGSVWEEWFLPGLENNFDASTMPFQLVRQPSGDFIFQETAWDSRIVGDIDSSPEPSFIDQKITDIFFHRNRLGFCSTENIIMSKAGFFFDFWRDTVLSIIDSDPIDIGVSHIKVSIIDHAVPYNESLLLFSGLTQFVLSSSGDLLTPSTTSIKQTTEFETTNKSKPVSVGKNVYFVAEKGDYSSIREYFSDNNTLTNDAANVTAHVPRYVPKDIFKLAASNNDDILFALSSDTPNLLYIYKYYWVGNQKPQSSWSTWTLDPTDTILNVSTINNFLYLIIERTDGVYLETLQLQPRGVDVAMGYPVLLDRRKKITGVYNSGSGKTIWTLPYEDTTGTLQAVLSEDFGTLKGKVLDLTNVTNTTVEAIGDFSAGDCYVGRTYEFSYEFSRLYPRERQVANAPSLSRPEGRLQLRTMTVVHQDTGYYEAAVTPKARDKNTTIFTGKILGDQSSTIGSPSISSGELRFPINTNSKNVTIRIVNNSHLPSILQSALWEGNYVTRAQRI